MACDGARLVLGGYRSFAVYDWVDGDHFEPSSRVEVTVPSHLARFGYTLGIHGDTVAATLSIHNSAFQPRVLVFRDSNGTWDLETELLPSDTFAVLNPSNGYYYNSHFGEALTFDGRGRLLVGATYAQRLDSPTPPPDALPGAAYLFERRPSGWEETSRFWDRDDTHQIELGYGVAFVGDSVAVSALRARGPVPAWSPGELNWYPLPLGDTVCDGVPNSTGSSGEVTLFGDRSVSFGHLEAQVAGLPADTPVMLLASPAAPQVSYPAQSAGVLCLGPPILRLVGMAGSADAAGDATLSLPGLHLTAGNTIQAGSSWCFQAWYRDGAVSPGSNLTGAVRVSFEM